MAALALPLILGGASLFGGLLGGRKQKTQSIWNQTQTQTPGYSPEQEGIYSELARQAMARLGGTTSLAGYEAGGLQNINRVSGLVGQTLQNRLAGQGLLGSPVAGNAMTQLELARGGQTAEFENQLPLLQNQLALQNMAAAGGVFGLRHPTMTSTSSGTGTNIGQPPGGMLGGGFSSLGGMLGLLASLGQLPGMNLDALAQIYGKRRS